MLRQVDIKSFLYLQKTWFLDWDDTHGEHFCVLFTILAMRSHCSLSAQDGSFLLMK